MRTIIVLVLLLVCAHNDYGCVQAVEPVWMGGSKTTCPTAGTYPPNKGGVGNPGSRWAAMSWTDGNGLLWLFGGFYAVGCCTSGSLNDMWSYDPSTGSWTWRGGTASLNGVSKYPAELGGVGYPGARHLASTWVDVSGMRLWMFGGSGYGETRASAYMNDLWSYDVTTGVWTWWGGAKTGVQRGIYPAFSGGIGQPGSRNSATTWTHPISGLLYMFGGSGYPASGDDGYLSDIWAFNPIYHTWFWYQSPIIRNSFGSYSAPFFPGSRYDTASWTTPNGELWLFGGIGNSEFTAGKMNDLWSYDGNNWTWRGGSSNSNILGTFPSSVGGVGEPGARHSSVAWRSGELFWLFSGQGYGNATSQGRLQDMWAYNTTSATWTWEGGKTVENAFGTFPTAVGGSGFPGCREGGVVWRAGNKVWLFSGRGNTATNPGCYLNDMWSWVV